MTYHRGEVQYAGVEASGGGEEAAAASCVEPGDQILGPPLESSEEMERIIQTCCSSTKW